jgi:hypothetical protein
MTSIAPHIASLSKFTLTVPEMERSKQVFGQGTS